MLHSSSGTGTTYPCGVKGVGDKEEGHHENHKGGNLKHK